jgi:hypothetical protein
MRTAVFLFSLAPQNAEPFPWSKTLMNEAPAPLDAGQNMSLPMAADLQDHLMSATNDLDRLQSLLADACDTLMQRFYGASEQMRHLMDAHGSGAAPQEIYQNVLQDLGGAVTALQFQDMASQLIHHTNRRLRNCADTLAREAFGQDEDGAAVVEDAPMRPNPVTQGEMDAGSIDLF